jgi:GntR family transcriptional regulator, transcriptional repressor for pyruvate dehydrogenase complex
MTRPGEPIRRSGLSTDLGSAIVAMISAEGLNPGQSIPSVRALAERFGVAVPTMREALRRLEGNGILEFRHGSGIYVGPNSNRLMFVNQLAPSPTRDQLLHLLRARLVIEPPISALAAQVRDPHGITVLEQALETARSCLVNADDALAKANTGIHRGAAAATGNPVLAEILDSLSAVHGADQSQILELYGDPDTDFAEHVQIVEHIVAGRVDAARTAMHDHLSDVIDVIAAVPQPEPTA